MSFALHPHLANKIFVQDLPLCRVLLEDEQAYPWLFLVPRRMAISRMMDLEPQDQLQLMQELHLAQTIVWELFHPTQINVASIGNKTPQLHMHVIGRYVNDPAWPATVWEHPVRTAYSIQQKEKVVHSLMEAFRARWATCE